MSHDFSHAGPPISPFEQHEDSSPSKKIKLNSPSPSSEDKEEFGFQVKSHSIPDDEEGDRDILENGEVEILEESGSEGELEAPPIPPRSHSLSPSPNMTPFHTLSGIYGEELLRSEKTSSKTVGDSFLSEGRGGGVEVPPPPPLPLPRLVNGFANGEAEMTTPPPPLPAKGIRKKSGPKLQEIAEEERMLMNELDLLEKMVENKGRDQEEVKPTDSENVDPENDTEL